MNNVVEFGKINDNLATNSTNIASLGGEYLFALNKNEESKVFGFKVGSSKIAVEYEDFTSVFDQQFYRLMNEYDENAHKIHPNTEYLEIPVLANVTYSLFD